MESQRIFILVGLMLVSVLLYQEWQSMYGPQPVQTVASETVSSDAPATSDDVPQASHSAQSAVPSVNATSGSIITVESDVLRLKIDLAGGDIVETQLLAYPVEQGGDEPIQILHRNSHFEYIAQSGLIGNDGPDSK